MPTLVSRSDLTAYPTIRQVFTATAPGTDVSIRTIRTDLHDAVDREEIIPSKRFSFNCRIGTLVAQQTAGISAIARAANAGGPGDCVDQLPTRG
jgi:hypothetical protein